MASRGQSWSRGLKVNLAIVLVSAMMAIVVIASTVFDYRRAGHFPHDGREVLGPISAALYPALSPSAVTLTRAPVAAFFLWQEGDRIAKNGDLTRARALIEEAVRRDPQLFGARAWLAADAVEAGRFAEAIRQFNWLYTLDESARPTIVPLIAGLARLPNAQRPIADFVAVQKPLWLKDVSDQLVHDKADPAIIFGLLGGGDSPSGRAGVSGLVGSLAGSKDYERAYLAWVSSLPPSAFGSVGYVYDREFRQLPGALPFNWRLFDSTAASTNFLKDGGVQISYYGDGPVHLIEQLLILPRGRFRFVALSGNAGTRDSNHVAWSIACVGGTPGPIARVDIPMAPTPIGRGTVFNVPENCPAQMLSLDGTPAEFTAPAVVTVKAVQISRVEGGS